jgi:hypothetical protein
MPPRAQDAAKAKQNLDDLENAIRRHNEHPPNPYDPDAVAAYNSQAAYYNYSAAQLEGEVESLDADLDCTPASVAQTSDAPNNPSWARPDPRYMQAPKGQKGVQMNVPGPANEPATIDGLSFSGHALDQLQGRGISLSAVERALRIGEIIPSRDGTTMFYDAINNVRVIQAAGGRIVTVGFGEP